MAITAADIENVSFSIGRKGYDVDEVDNFLEFVANEIDALNNQIVSMQAAPAPVFDEPVAIAEPEPQVAPAVEDSAKDDRIAELERMLAEKRADDSAISQALIVAQRSADDIIAKAKAEAADIIRDAEDEADRIVTKAEAERQKVMDTTRALEDEREEVRLAYQGMLTDFIDDANAKLQAVAAAAPAARSRAAAGFPAHSQQAQVSAFQVPVNMAPAAVEKDLSGFGDADDFDDFDEID